MSLIIGGWNDAPPPPQWTIEIAKHIKSISPNSLVMDGTMGGLDGPNRLQWKALTSNEVDIFSNHYYYGEGDYERIKVDSRHVAEYANKVFVIGEFGFKYDVCKEIYDITLKNKNVAGALIWSLRFHSRYGGFYTHSEGNDYWSYHVPGFSKAKGFGADDYRMALVVREYGLSIDGQSNKTKFPTPSVPLEVKDVSIQPSNLRWVGSAWASRYLLFRKVSLNESANDGIWRLIRSRLIDNVEPRNMIFNDDDAPKGKYVSYLIQPVSVDGEWSFDNHLVIGPYFT